ncbi:MAG: hypothetical protein EKK41_19940 [Hyphomicrobiales bacterium]|nr:MAG: hypothetical protein EKK41_19940 [Hyphomicrobiales bacterium]
MRDHFGPEDVRTLYRAFDLAWTALGDDISGDRDALRDHIGRAVIHLAKDGHMDEIRLATYAAYQGRSFMGLRTRLRSIG